MSKQLSRYTLTELLNTSVELYADYHFVSFIDSPPYTYRSYAKTVEVLRIRLKEKGVKKGDRVAILGENMPNWGLCYFAVVTLGAIAVPILTDFHPDEIRTIIEHSGASGVFVSEKMQKKVPDLILDDRWGIEMNEFEDIAGGGLPAGGRQTAAIPRPSDSKEDSLLRIPDEVAEEDTAVIIYTSGTTGNPKGVMLSHRSISHNTLGTTEIPRRLRPGDRLLSLLPLAHTYECTIGFLTPMILGCRIFYMRKPPAPSVLLPALKKVKPQVVVSVPLLIEKIYRNLIAPKLNKSRFIELLLKVPPLCKLIHRSVGAKLRKTFGGKLKYFILGGAALAEDVERFLREARFPIAIGYGLTETSPLVAGSTMDYAKPYTIGPLIRGVHVRIESEDPARVPGEVLVRGPNVMQGYYREEEKTHEVLDANGWFHTGDLGTLDKDGYLALKGRLKNLILGPSGENIYPESIEAVLNQFEFVNDSVVFEEGGQLLAKVHIDYDAFMEHMRDFAESAVDMSKDVSKQVTEYLNKLRKGANTRLNAFSRLHSVLEQKEPFERTPTRKIKRYLYTSDGAETEEKKSSRGKTNEKD
jgi:long-chain acyl-CoA synthetase